MVCSELQVTYSKPLRGLMGSSASKEQQDSSGPAEDLDQKVFHDTALYFCQLFFPLP